MSVVLAYADEQMAIVTSDGRVSDILGNIISEDYPKVRKICMNVIMGYAGHAIPCNTIADFITNPESSRLTQDARVEDVVDSIQTYMSSYPKGLNIGFVVCGMGRNGKMRTEIVTPGGNSQIYHPGNEEPFFCAMYPKEIPTNAQVFENELLSKSPEDAMRETIKICANLSQTVNQNVFLERLQIFPLKY